MADAFDGGVVDLSIGTPCDPPPAAVVRALAGSGAERGYPPSIGSPELRSAVQRWIGRRFDVDVPIAQIGACIGTKEFVGTLPQWLRLRTPGRDTVLYPAVAYPTYEMGAILAGCRAVPVPVRPGGGLDLDAVTADDADRALCLWVNSPSNPTGALDDLDAAAAWGRRHGVPVFSDECYVEFTWDGPPRTILDRRARRRGGRPLAVEAIEPGRRAGRLLRRRLRAGDLSAGGAQARRDDGAGPGPGGRRGRPRRRRPRRRPAGPVPPPAGASWPAPCRRGPASTSVCPRAASTCGSTPATAGRSPSGWPRRAASW